MSDDLKENFSKIINLIKDFESLEGKRIQEALFSDQVVISETPEDAVERSNYEQFLKDNLAEEKNMQDYLKNFVSDIVRKHLG